MFVATTVLAAEMGRLEQSIDKVTVQGAAPNGLLSQLLTVASTTIDLTGSLWWNLDSPTACKYRLMPTTAKSTYPQFTVHADTPIGWVVNKLTPFINFSGCTSGGLSRQ